MNKPKLTRAHLSIVIISCLLAMASMGILNSAIGVFIAPVSESLSVLNGTFSLHFTIQFLAAAFTSIIVPKVFKKFEFKYILLINIILVSASTFLMGFATNIIHFYVLAAIRGFSASFISIFPITMVVNNWFVKYRGIIISIVMSFTGVAGAVFSPIFSTLIENIGWRSTYMIVGVILLLLCIPSLILKYNLTPDKYGIIPLGEKVNLTEEKYEQRQKISTFNFLQIFFIVTVAHCVLLAGLTSLSQYLPMYAISLQYSTNIGALLVTITMIGNIVSKLIIGFIADYKNTVVAICTMIIVTAFGVGMLYSSNTEVLMFIGAFCFGAAYSLGSVGVVLLTTDFFGTKNYTKVYPVMSVFTSIGVALSMPIIGYIYDFTQSYKLIFGGVFILYTLTFLAVILLHKNRVATS